MLDDIGQKSISGHNLPRTEQHQSQQRAPFPARNRDDLSAVHHLERSKDPKLHTREGNSAVTGL
jgi:hypothetical protein